MKKSVTAIVLFFYSVIVSAQAKLPSFHKIDKPDLEMTDCDFDKGATAIKLIDYGRVYYDRGTEGITAFKVMYEYRVRIKILKDKGLSYANVEIPFYNYNNDEKITNVDACTYNLDETGKIKITDVGKSSIYTKKMNKFYSRLVIAFPEVKTGSVVEYKYRLESEFSLDIKRWDFQDDIPTRYSEYDVSIPRMFIFTPQPTITDSVEIKEKESDDVVSFGNEAYTFKIFRRDFIMRNLAGIRNEPFMGSVNDYKQRIEFVLSQIDHGNNDIENRRSNWTDIIRSLDKDEDFGQQLTKDIPELTALITQALSIPENENRIAFLFESIRSKMDCNDKEAKYTEAGLVKAWQKKTGNIAEINLLLVYALNKAGIKALPILLSTRDNGLVNTLYYSLKQFNVVMAYIKTGDGFLVLDASDKISNYKLTPESIVNTRGFLADNGNGKWVDVIDNAHKYAMVMAIQGTIDEKGMMAGECSINCSDYARKQRVERYRKNADEFKQHYFIKPYPSVAISDVIIKNAETDSLPLSQKIIFSMPVNNSGGYSYFNTNMFNDFESNPFIEENRVSDIDFGFQQEYLFYGRFTIPEGYVFETLPENISMTMPGRGIQFNRSMSASENILSMKIDINFRQSFYLAGAYGDFHAFYKKLLNSLNEQVVIKKK